MLVLFVVGGGGGETGEKFIILIVHFKKLSVSEISFFCTFDAKLSTAIEVKLIMMIGIG